MNVAILGYGTVGGGVAEVLTVNKESIAARVGEELHIKYILDIREFPGDPHEKLVTKDFDAIVNDPEVKVVCETMGGLKPAYDFTKRLLEAGKSVCTSNKELVAAYGPELIALAKANSCMYLFEASVGGGIPIIRPLLEALTAEEVGEITGILNGTTNYMLTKMDREGSDYADVLKEAQDNGYAEHNPEADVEGYDACRKIAILASLNYGKTVDYKEIYTEGISRITKEDFDYAGLMKKSIKLLGFCREEQGKRYAMVAPFLLDEEHPLYSVRGVFNGILVHGNMVDDVVFIGRGAGKLPTASAVVSDIIEEARNIGKASGICWTDEKLTLNDKAELKFRYMVRMSGNAATSKFRDVFPGAEELDAEILAGEYAFVTGEMTEGEFLEKYATLSGTIKFIRIR